MWSARLSVQDDRGTAGSNIRRVTLELAASGVERVTPAIRLLMPPLLALLGAGAVSAAIISHAIWRALGPIGLNDLFVFALALALLLLPAALLFLFWLALTAINELPDKLRRLPETAVRHGSTLTEIVRETRARPVSGIGWLRNLARTAKLLYSAKEDLLLYAPLLELLNPILLLGTVLAVPAVLLECVIAALILASRVG